MKRPAAGASPPESSAVRDDEERVDYDDPLIGDAADGNRGDEDADVGNMSGSPSPGTTAATTSEQSAPLEEQHLRGSPTATVPPVALPETTVATPPPEQQLVPVLAPVQEQPTPVVLPETTVAASPTALLKISLTPTEAQPSTSQARAMMALTSSPSQLNISTASAASAPGSPALTSMARGVSSAMVSSLADAPEFLQISLVMIWQVYNMQNLSYNNSST
ncbi:classical arabinogalactan protein 9-like [Asparagus officinalis]|uniref:classical arabinogalactan protein 9-like n=1 Tax=Asparagus officinalis TaxID=4686 RepID=UPI00098E799A|nr:classical arabinogalactan protein 9-like [Asparagus officinalis]